MHQAVQHYIVVCVGTVGDIHPFMRVAHALQALGKTVTFITNTYHAGLLKGSGLAFVGLGTDEDYLRMIRDPNIWHPQKAFSAILAHYDEQLLQIEAAIRGVGFPNPTVVIAHPFSVPGVAMARELGRVDKIVSLYLAPSTIRTCHDPLRIGDLPVPRWVPMSWRRALWRFIERGWIDPFGMPKINAARSTLGLPPAHPSYLSYIERRPDLTVALFPSWFGPTMPDWPKPLLSADFQLFEASGSEHLPEHLLAFLAAGDRPLVFTPGTGNIHASKFFACALDAVQRLGERAIFLTKDRGQVPDSLPPSVVWQPYVPLSGLLPRAKALIHHGGVGTTAEALRAGLPQLVTPFAWDQFDNGARVAELGMGLVIPASKLSPRKMRRAVGTVIASSAMRSCGALVARRFTGQADPIELCLEIERRLPWPASNKSP